MSSGAKAQLIYSEVKMMYVIEGDTVMSDWYYDTKHDMCYNIQVEPKKKE